MSHPPIIIHRTELVDRLVVWYSANHPDNLSIKKDLRELGYSIETMGDVYTIAGPNLTVVKGWLEALYVVPEGDRSALKEEEKQND